MSRRFFVFFILITLLTGCTQFPIGRSFLSDLEHDDSAFFTPKEDFPVVAGDTGKYWNNDDIGDRTPADLSTRVLIRELRGLERSQSDQCLDFYERHKAKLVTTSEKIYFLKLPPYERRDYLIGRGFISEPKRPIYQQMDRKVASDKQDNLMGMKKDQVMNSWGKPTQVEVVGNPRNENERWHYDINGASKYIYFEGGVVQGWE